jgi:RNA polymerase sigma factor (sigma-70 family)
MQDWPDEELLRQLGGAAAGEAWAAFLQKFTPLIIRVARQYQHDEQSLHDCYLFVCEKLFDDGFRRLRAWRQKDNVRFASWLRAVVANLCVDWHRSENGRSRPFRTIAELPELERAVYMHRFEFGAGFKECFEAVSVNYPQVTELEVAAIIRQLNRLLTPQQHWAIVTRRRSVVSIDDRAVRREVESGGGESETPEAHVTHDQEQRRLHRAMLQLPPQQRLLLRLRYRQGLTLKDVARLTGFDDPFKARYQIQLALDRLRDLLQD